MPPPTLPLRDTRLLGVLLPLLLLLTGAVGLVYEVVLGRLLSQHLGSSGSSQAVTLATFLGGMALGAVVAERWVRPWVLRHRHPLRAYAALEAMIGLWALCLRAMADGLFGVFGALSEGLEPESTPFALAKLALAAVVLLPLTVCMGATLPALASGIGRLQPARGVALVTRFYAANAGGATLGAAVAGFWAIPALGLHAPLVWGGLVNLGVAGAVWFLGPQAPGGEQAPTEQTQARANAIPRPALLFAAAATGFVALSAEVLWTRLVALCLGSSAYAFAFMLVVAIAGVSLGSAIAGALIGRGWLPARVLSGSQALAAVGTAFLLSRLDRLPLQLAELRLAIPADGDHYATWLWTGFGVLALHVLPAALALGASFPALLAAADAAGAATDRATARILAWNTVGNLVGALSGGFVLMPLLGLEGALLLGMMISLVVALLTSATPGRPRSWPDLAAPALAALVAGGLLLGSMPDGQNLTRGLFRLRDVKPGAVAQMAQNYAQKVRRLYRHDGKDATITVHAQPGGVLSLETNGKSDGGTASDSMTQVILGLQGTLHRPNARRALVVGLGTGQTVAAMVSAPQLHVQVVELSPAVVDAAALFVHANQDILHHPRVRVTVADAREVLRTQPDAALDIVVSEPSNPWVAGVGDLFTQESFARIARKLRPDGVLVQWLQTYETSPATVRSVVCTLRSVFAYVEIWRGTSGDLALVASASPLTLDLEAAAALVASPDMQAYLGRLEQPQIPRTMEALLAGQLGASLMVDGFCQGFADPLLDAFPRIEYEAPRDFFARRSAQKLIHSLDHRVGRAPQTFSDLALHQWLAVHPLDSARRRALYTHLHALNHPLDTPLWAGLLPLTELPAWVGKSLADVPVWETADGATRKRVCDRLHADVPWVVAAAATVLGPVLEDPALMRWAAGCQW